MCMTTKASFLLLLSVAALSTTDCWGLQAPHQSQRAPRRRTERNPSATVRENSALSRSVSTSSNSRDDDDIFALEQDVIESTRARMDMKRVQEAFLEEDTYDYNYGNVQERGGAVESWKVALSAGIVSSVFANFLLLHSFILSSLVCAGVFFVANGDPLEEDSVAGALARVVGRFTLQSVQVSQPKVRAIARAAVRGDDEVTQLLRRVDELEDENEELFLWKERRQAVDEALSEFNVDELKEKARKNRITIGGTKSQLLMRLVEADIIRL
mmetsp:Transcript_493/g.813  ORF Transcript_493/g.813 Transcript_493/m.813 type:complete len:270 (+) Transcript_493:55-864(+)